MPCLWYRIDEGDADVATFFYYMGLAVKRLLRTRKSLPLFTQEYVRGLNVFALRYFETLYGSLRPGSLVVLDNYERVAEDSSLHEVVSRGMSVLPVTVRVIVISRKGPLPQFVSLQGKDKIGRLGWDDCVSASKMRGSSSGRGGRRMSPTTSSNISMRGPKGGQRGSC